MNTDPGTVIVAIARDAIGRALGFVSRVDESADWLREPAASFVTLRRAGALRGCIGTLEAHRPLIEDLKANATAAAFRDPRFPPLRPSEWPDTRLEVSVLSALEPLSFESEADALAKLRPMHDGVVLRVGALKSTFLPKVWETLPDAGTFLGHLKRKAGLPEDFWSHEVQLSRYTVREFSEP